MTRILTIFLTLAALSQTAWANEYGYQARIEGMVCAFCAYNVGKTIGTLPGVDAESISVDLEANLVGFHTRGRVEWAEVSAAFADSGFVLATLDQVDSPATKSTSSQGSPLIGLDFDGVDAERFETILEAIGEIASTQSLRLVIEAPEAIEIDVLEPILMGRKQVINVRYVPTNKTSIHLEMFPASSPVSD